MRGIAESAVEEATLEWFEGLPYTVAHGPDIAVDRRHPERTSYADVLLVDRLRAARTGGPAAIRDALLPKLLSGEIRVGYAEKAVREVA